MRDVTGEGELHVEGYFDFATKTVSYIVLDRVSNRCALIDTVLDYDMASGRICYTSADRLIARVRELDAQVDWILETHVHADHLTAAPYMKSALGGQMAIGQHVKAIQKKFGAFYNLGEGFRCDGSQFDRLFADGERIRIGGLSVLVMHTPGHTPACVSYVVSDGRQDVAFVGDTLFMPDFGTARCDFPGGDARQLYQSIQRLLDLPASTRLYTGHDYQPGGRDVCFEAMVQHQRATNIHVGGGKSEEQFVAMRKARDVQLDLPALLLPSIQINMRGGHFPDPEENGVRYLKIPLDAG